MNRIENKDTAKDAARLFEQEVMDLSPGIPREEVCSMVDDYLYYQQDELSRAETHVLVDETCLSKNRN